MPAPAADGGGGNGLHAPPPDFLAEEAAVGPLLARANLLRMRGQWDEAVAACTEALRRAPGSPTAHSLLGDIYEAQGKTDDAVQWYGMALDCDPTNRSDRAKLERLVLAQRRALLQEERAAQERAAQRPAGTAERTLGLIDRLFPPGKSESVARLILVACAGIALLLVCAAVFVLLSNDGEGGAPGALVQPPSPAHTVVVQPPPPADVPPRRPGATRAPDAPSPAGRVPARGAAPSAPPANDAALLEEIRRGLPPSVSVAAAQVDPRTAHADLAVIVPVLPATTGGRESPGQTRERILRGAVLAARVAALAVPDLERISVRVSLRGAGTGDTPAPAPQLAFVGDTAATVARAADPAAWSGPQLRELFTNPWWAPPLVPGVPAAQP